MKPGERIRLIKEAGEALAYRGKTDLQLILRVHGAETWDYESDWPQSTDEYEYVIGRLESLEDERLIQVHEYVLGEDAAPRVPDASTAIWGSSPVRIFISHHHEDAQFAGALRDLLKGRFGIDAFVAHDDIDPSAKWRESIRRALDSCHFLVALLHDSFHMSQWCDQEVGWAMGRGIPVMPVRRLPFNGERHDGFLEEHQECLVDPTRGGNEFFLANEILMALLRDARTHDVGVQALVEALVNSFSFDQTRRLWPLIAQEPYLRPENLRRLEYAVETNSQVYDANASGQMVPDLVRQLVQKFEPTQASWNSDEPPF